MASSSTNLRSDPVVGIDLGTTNSLVAVAAWPSGSALCARVVPDESERGGGLSGAGGGGGLLASVVRFDAGGGVVVGQAARDGPEGAGTVVSSVKRLMGRSARDAAGDAAYLPYEVVAGENVESRGGVMAEGGARVVVPGWGRGVVSPQEVSAYILKELRERASAALGVEVRRAVVTVPAYFDDGQRQATREAGRIAGLEVVRIINEPTAAALAYGIGVRGSKPASGEPRESGESGERAKRMKGGHGGDGVGGEGRSGGGVGARLIAVYDLGGGTFDVSILRITASDHGAAQSDSSVAAGDAGNERSEEGASEGGKELGTGVEETAYFEVLATAGDTHLGGDDIDHALARLVMERARAARPDGEFPVGPEGLSGAERRRLVAACERAKVECSSAESAVVRWGIDRGAGGDGGAGSEVTLTREDVEEAARGLIARSLECCARAVRDAGRGEGKSEGERLGLDAVVMVGGSTRMPAVRRAVSEFFGMEAYTAIDPDEVVALGAAVQGAILDARARDALLFDVIPLSLGIETVGGAVAKIVMRNSGVPARATEMFSTSVDGQGSIELHVVQGEREMAADCRSLGRFRLSGVPAMPAGIPQVEVEFLVDVNGVLTVRAVERRSGKRASIQVTPNHGLTADEVERIERESVEHARDDMARHRVVDLIANAKLDVKWVRRQVDAQRGRLDSALVNEVEKGLSEVESLIARAEADWRSVDADAFHAAKEALDRASVPVHEVAIRESLRGT